MDLSYLSEKERESILQVLKRDEDLRKKDEQKVHHLKSELYFLRKRGALRGDLDPESTCSRCRVTLGRVLNRGAICNSCQSKVCKSCRAYSQTGDQWMCVVCHKQMEIQAASGEWMNEFVRRPSKRRDNKVFIPPADLIKHSIKRSWTSADGFRRNIDTSGAVKETPRQAGPSHITRHLPKLNEQQVYNSRKLSSRRGMMEPPSRSGNQQSSPRMASSVIRVPQPPITAPARPSSRTIATSQKPSESPKSDVTTVSDNPEPEPEPEPEPDPSTRTTPTTPTATAPSPAPRCLKSLPTPAPRTGVESTSRASTPNRSPNRSPLQRSPIFKHTSPTESERHNSSESQDSGYTTTQHPLPSSAAARNAEMFDSGFDNQGSPRTSKSSGISRQSSGVSSNKNDWRDPGVESGTASEGSDNEFNNEVVFRKVMVRKKREKEKKMSAISDVLQAHPQAPAVCWGSIGGAHSLPRTKSRLIHSLSMPSYKYSASLIDSDACDGLLFPSNRPFSILGGSLTLLHTEQLDRAPSDLSNFCEDNGLTSPINPWEGSLVLRSLDGTHRKTPTGSPVVKRIRRSQRESSERGGRLRSPERNQLRNNFFTDFGGFKCSFEDVHVAAALEFEEDLVHVTRSFDSNSDIVLGISADKCIPESDDYKLVFISSSSSKSSGLNSLDGSVVGTSSANSSPRVSILDDSDVLLFIDEKSEDRDSNICVKLGSQEVDVSNEHTLRISTTETVSHQDGATVVSISPSDTSTSASASASYQEIVESFSPTHSVDEMETTDHVLATAGNGKVTVKSSGTKQFIPQHVNRYFVRSDSTRSSSERSVDEVSVSHCFSSVISGPPRPPPDMNLSVAPFVTNICDDDAAALVELDKKPILLQVSGWTDKDLNDPRLDDEDSEMAVSSFVENAVNIVGETSVMKSTVVSEGWDYCMNSGDESAMVDLTETQSVHCNVDDDTMSLGTFSEGGLSCQLTPDVDCESITQPFICSDGKKSEKDETDETDIEIITPELDLSCDDITVEGVPSCQLTPAVECEYTTTQSFISGDDESDNNEIALIQISEQSAAKSIDETSIECSDTISQVIAGLELDLEREIIEDKGHEQEQSNDANDKNNNTPEEDLTVVSCKDLLSSDEIGMKLLEEANEHETETTHGVEIGTENVIKTEMIGVVEKTPSEIDIDIETAENNSLISNELDVLAKGHTPEIVDNECKHESELQQIETCDTQEMSFEKEGERNMKLQELLLALATDMSTNILFSVLETDFTVVCSEQKPDQQDQQDQQDQHIFNENELKEISEETQSQTTDETVPSVKTESIINEEEEEEINIDPNATAIIHKPDEITEKLEDDVCVEDDFKSTSDVDVLEDLIAKSKEINQLATDDSADHTTSALENYFVHSLGGMTVQIAEDGPSSLEKETMSETQSEGTLDQWESETEKQDESIEDSDTTFSDSVSSDEASFDAEEELRSFSRAIDFSLHTIIEESCEESDHSEKARKKTNSPPQVADETDLEKYFSFTIGNSLLALSSKRKSLAEESEASDSYSETSGSVCSEGIDKIDEDIDPAELASSRLEKYFMTGFLGIDKCIPFEDNMSESEGDGENNKIAKRKVSGRSKGIIRTDSVGSEMSSTSQDVGQVDSDNSSSTLSDENGNDESVAPFDKNEGFDTIKRQKKGLSVLEVKDSEPTTETGKNKNNEKSKEFLSDQLKIESTSSFVTPLPDGIVVGGASSIDKAKSIGLDRKQQSRDSGFIGSSDDLLKDSTEALSEKEFNMYGMEENMNKILDTDGTKTKVVREGSTSDDETRYIVGQLMDQITRGLAVKMNGSPLLPRAKPPELEMFETELTKLMKTVPGIDATVKEIVEELSSTDYYSDSYESSDYNSSEHEGPSRLTLLRRSLRSSLRSNDDLRLHWPKDANNALENPSTIEVDGVPDFDDPLREDANSPFTRETIYIYEKLMTSLGRMAEQAGSDNEQHQGNQSPASTRSQRSTTLQAVQHIRERLTSLMREVHASSESSLSTRVKRNNSSSSSSSWMGSRMEPKPVFQTHGTHDGTSRPFVGSLHADITRWLAKQPFHSDEQSICSSSTNYESEDSPTDTELSVESDDTASPALNKKTKEFKSKSSVAKLDRCTSERTIIDDNLSLNTFNTSASLFPACKLSENTKAGKTDCLLADGSNLKSLSERGVLDLQYFVTQGINNEYEVWQSMVVDEEKFKHEELASKERDGEIRPIRARHLLGSMKSSSSDTLQCISEEDLDSKPSSTRTSMIGSSSNICSSQSSLVLRGSCEALGSTPERVAHSPCGDFADSAKGAPVTLRKTYGFVAVDIPFKENEVCEAKSSADYRSSFHTEILESGEIAHAKDKIDFRSSLQLWMENQMKPATRAMSADPLPQDYMFLNPLAPKTSTPSSQDSLIRPKSSAFNLSDNQLDRRTGQASSVQYSTMTKSGPIGTLLPEPPPQTRKALTLPRDLSANVSFLHKNSAENFLTNTPPTTVVLQDSLKGRGESLSRREVRSWTAEDSGASTDSKSLTKFAKTAKGGGVSIPQISVSDTADIVSQSIQSNPSGRSSLCSQNTSDKESVPEEDIDRLVALHKTRSSLSSLGNRSDSMTSVYSAAGGGRYGTVDVRGEVLFGLGYNFKLGALEVHVKKCRDLAPVDIKRNRSDPYVKVYLLPDKSKSGKRKTKVKKHTLNPTFDEVLRFFVTISELETRTLWLTVWHSDMFGRNDFLGEVMLPLGYDVIDDDSTPKWYLLQERLGPPEEVLSYKGELVIALKYVPLDVTTQKKGKLGKGKLHVLVKEARNLTAVRSNGTSDPFCKCYLLPDKSKNSKQKTQVVKKNCNPKWNHTFVYDDVDIDDLRERCLELTVWDYDRLTSNDFLGGVRLSLGSGRFQGKEVDWLDSRGDEIELWQNMLDKPNVWIDGFIFLEPTMEKRPL